MKILTFCGVERVDETGHSQVQMKKGKLKECAVTVLYDPHAATDHRVDMLDQLASQELPQAAFGKIEKASVISLDHAKKATHNESVKHPEILSDMIRLQNLIPETKHDNVTPSSKHDVIKTTKKWHDPHEAVSSTTVENGPQYISMAQEQDEEAVRSGKKNRYLRPNPCIQKITISISMSRPRNTQELFWTKEILRTIDSRNFCSNTK